MMSNRTCHSSLLSSQSGFTLVELVIVMGIFIIAIMLSSDTFNRIATLSTQQIKSSESNIQGIVGLELMRSDIEHAGYGLPWVMPFIADFEESQVAPNYLAKGINPAVFNDKNNASDDSFKVPRAYQSAAASYATADPANPLAPADPATDGRDYLVLKSTAIGMSTVSKKWTYVEGVGASATLKLWHVDDFVSGERVIVQDSRTRGLIAVTGATALAPNVSDSGKTFSDILDDPAKLSKVDFAPQQNSDVYLVYGVTPNSNLRVPYNRADYYIKRPTTAGSMPKRCAPGTGILYKALLAHTGGGVTQYPLLECVADMQVVYHLVPDSETPVAPTPDNQDALQGLSAAEIRKQLKRISVYILAHEGQKDITYSYSETKILVGESASLGREFVLSTLDGIGTDWKHYRWKVFYFTVTPRNLNY